MSHKKSHKKKELILKKAKQVFIRKGFVSTTMKDIAEECKISRGGLYLYFKSVDEIFIQVIINKNEEKLKETKEGIAKDKSFLLLINEYFDKQKKRLMNMENSLLMAMHEYRFAHKDDSDNHIFYNQFFNTKSVILELLNYGVKQNEIEIKDIDSLAMNIMFFIEGISTLAATSGVSESIIESQVEFIKKIIFKSN